jgi:hypothetical protein
MEDYAPETNILYHFTKYVEWPEQGESSGAFVIGICGNEKVFSELKKGITGRHVGNRKIEVIKIDTLDKRLINCSLLFVSADRSSRIKKINSITQNHPVLVVTEKEGLLAREFCMNLVIVNEKVRLEINNNNIEHRGLKVANELIGMALNKN